MRLAPVDVARLIIGQSARASLDPPIPDRKGGQFSPQCAREFTRRRTRDTRGPEGNGFGQRDGACYFRGMVTRATPAAPLRCINDSSIEHPTHVNVAMRTPTIDRGGEVIALTVRPEALCEACAAWLVNAYSSGYLARQLTHAH